MVKKAYICDRCNNEIGMDPELARVTLPMWASDKDNEEDYEVCVDLCKSCQLELDNLLRHHFLGTNNGEYTMRDAPYAEIAALETYLEDAHKDVEELEEELERLRDVKDKLFEANFKLTAQLRALGVEVDTEEDNNG